MAEKNHYSLIITYNCIDWNMEDQIIAVLGHQSFSGAGFDRRDMGWDFPTQNQASEAKTKMKHLLASFIDKYEMAFEVSKIKHYD